MPTFPTHAVAAVAIGTAFPRASVPRRFWIVGAVCAMVPDADVIGFRLGVRYSDFLGHRGFTHSLCFAAVVAVALTAAAPREEPGAVLRALYLFLATASHGILDAFTDGGLGVALFSPFYNSRFFFPVRPIVVSPIGLRGVFSSSIVPVLTSELRWVWLPSAAFAAAALALTRQRSK